MDTGRTVDLGAVLAPDHEGVVWGYRFHEDGQAEALGPGEALRALEAQQSWVWLHVDLVDQRVRAALARQCTFPPEAVTLLLGGDERQQLHTFGDAVAGVIADFERADEPDPRNIVTWRFCMAQHAFISGRRRPLEGMAQLQADVRAGRRFPGVLHLFDAIVHAFASAMGQVNADLQRRLDAVEDALLDERDTGDFGTLGAARRDAVRLHRQAMPLRAMLHHLMEDRPAWFTDDAAEDCERVVHRLDSLTADLVSLQERARAMQDEIASRQTEETNKRLMLLSIIGAMLLPPTLITGLFGMNVEGLPFKDNPHAFLYTCIVMAVSVGLLMVILRRVKLI